MSKCCNHYKKDDYDCYDKKRYDYYDNDKKKKDDCRAIIECGREIFRSLPTTNFDAITNSDTPIPLAEVTIDTRELRKPCVALIYSSIVSASTDSMAPTIDTLQLTFRLVRKCKGEEEEELRTWIYERTYEQGGSVELTTSDSFTVTFCECFDRACCDEKARKCCTYTMQLVKVAGNVDANGNLEASYNITEKNIFSAAACPSCIW